MSEKPGIASRYQELRVSIPARVADVRQAVGSIRAFLESQGIPTEDAAAFELVLAEAANNAIEHAPELARTLPITLTAAVGSGDVECRVEDHTNGFDWPDRIELPSDDAERGRGLFLIHALTDSATYYRGGRVGNVLVLRKRRRGAAATEGVDFEARCRELESRLAEDERVVRDMADELSSCYESLAAIFRYSGEQPRPDSLEVFSRRLLDDLLRVTGSEWYVLRLLRPETNQLMVSVTSEPGLFVEPLPMGASAGATDPIELQAVVGHRDCWFEHTDRLAAGDPLARVRPGSGGLVHPVFLGETLVGSLAVGGKAAGRRFTAAQMSVVQTFADFLAIQIVNSRFQEERVRNLLVAQELQIAKNIQRSLLPESLPQPAGMTLAGTCENANEVGGDFFDVIPVSESAVLVVIGDVMGKGLPAAMFALVLRSLVRALRDFAATPGVLLARANELLHEELSRVEMFITAQVAYVDAHRGQLVLANAGHCPALLGNGLGTHVRALAPEGMPLGVLRNPSFTEEVVYLEAGARCMLYTDGVTEASGRPAGALFGQNRLLEWFQGQCRGAATPEAMKIDLVQTLARYRESQDPSDDQTLVIIGR